MEKKTQFFVDGYCCDTAICEEISQQKTDDTEETLYRSEKDRFFVVREHTDVLEKTMCCEILSKELGIKMFQRHCSSGGGKVPIAQIIPQIENI